jgi:predicted nucleic acid-binding protein
VKVYLDVCCLNRPFDDQSQPRVRDEAEAVRAILERADKGLVELVGSQMMRIELRATPDLARRRKVRALLPRNLLQLDTDLARRTRELAGMGFKPADAVHISAAERLQSVALVTTDDRLVRLAKRRATRLRVRVLNVLSFIAELKHADEH